MTQFLFPFRFSGVAKILDDSAVNPKEFMYGAFDLFKKDGFDYYYEPKDGGVFDNNYKKLEKKFSKVVGLGMCHEVILNHIEKVSKADVLVTINDAMSFAALYWSMEKKINCSLVTFFQSLTERRLKKFAGDEAIEKEIKSLLSFSSKIVVLSNAAKEELIKIFSIESKKIEVFYFGADADYWTYNNYNNHEGGYILSVGNDLNRDYATLLYALPKGVKLKVVSSKLKNELVKKRSVLKNLLRDKLGKSMGIDKSKIDLDQVEFLDGISNDALKKLYQNADLVVTPNKSLQTESSGLSTTVQAMACGTPVIIADAPPMREMFEEGKDIIYYKAEDSNSLCEAINMALKDKHLLGAISKNARGLVEAKYNAKSMSIQLQKILAKVF